MVAIVKFLFGFSISGKQSKMKIQMLLFKQLSTIIIQLRNVILIPLSPLPLRGS